MKTYDLSKYRQIEPDALIHFLFHQGWRESDKKDGIVAIWGIEKEGEIRKILLPLNSGSPDYANRMLEAIKTVGLVEAREETDLLESLLNNSMPTSTAIGYCLSTGAGSRKPTAFTNSPAT